MKKLEKSHDLGRARTRDQRMLSQLLPTVLMLQLPNLAFFDHLYTLSYSKAKLISSAVSFCKNLSDS
jgi:hypothetical protein